MEAKRDQTFPDPQQFDDEAKFNYAAKTTSLYKKIVQEIFIEIDKHIQSAQYLQKKEQGEMKDNFGIGRQEEGEENVG